MKCKDIERKICKRMSNTCHYLNDAHKDKAKHKVMEKSIKYQRTIGSMEDMNEISNQLGLKCFCKEIAGPRGKHIGHKFIKR
jgi:hypothetical protein